MTTKAATAATSSSENIKPTTIPHASNLCKCIAVLDPSITNVTG